jgi:DNA-binding NarL/FixJ family response regulator
MTAAPVRVLVVDDDPLVRRALHTMLDGHPGVEIVGEVGDGHDVPAAVSGLAPQVVLMDIRMPKVDGLTATEALRRTPDPPEVIVLTTFDTDEIAARLFMSVATVKSHITRILTTLDLTNRVQIALLAHDAGREQG